MKYLILILSLIFISPSQPQGYRTFTVEELEFPELGTTKLEVTGFSSNRYNNDQEVLAGLTVHILFLYKDDPEGFLEMAQGIFEEMNDELEIRKL